MKWGNTYPSRLTKAPTKQNKCTGVFTAYFLAIVDKVVHLTLSFKLLDILNVDNIFKLKISLLGHKLSQNVGNASEVLQRYT